MAIDTENKRRVIAMTYFIPDAAIDTEAERRAIAYLYTPDNIISIAAIFGGTVFGQNIIASIKGQHTIANIDGQDTTATIKGAG